MRDSKLSGINWQGVFKQKGHKEMGVKQGLSVVWLKRVIFFNSVLKSLPEMK